MRHEIRADSLPFGIEAFREAFAPIAEEFSMQWRITDTAQKKRVVLMASRESHCLADLLHRWHSDELDCDISCVISNHNDLRSMVEWHGIPFYHVPVDPKDKQPAFAEVSRLVKQHEAEVVVLARYMQILPPDLCSEYAVKVINIHHSFLPSFVGAKPYHQASMRGVKLIGATATTSPKSWTPVRSSSRTWCVSATVTALKTWCVSAVTSRRWCWPVACVITSKTACWCTATKPSCFDARRFLWSGLARDSVCPVRLTNRVVCIASKPAPTDFLQIGRWRIRHD
jgi:hypothetical protein